MTQEENITYITQEGLHKLKEEYDDLKNNKIPTIATRIDEARQQGDLSENAEYNVAREDMVWAQTRLTELEETLRHVQIIKKSDAGSTVQMGSTVVVSVKEKQKEFTIVGIQEVDPTRGRISHESPLAQALMDHRAGDRVEVAMPAGLVEYTILEIK